MRALERSRCRAALRFTVVVTLASTTVLCAACGGGEESDPEDGVLIHIPFLSGELGGATDVPPPDPVFTLSGGRIEQDGFGYLRLLVLLSNWTDETACQAALIARFSGPDGKAIKNSLTYLIGSTLASEDRLTSTCIRPGETRPFDLLTTVGYDDVQGGTARLSISATREAISEPRSRVVLEPPVIERDPPREQPDGESGHGGGKDEGTARLAGWVANAGDIPVSRVVVRLTLLSAGVVIEIASGFPEGIGADTLDPGMLAPYRIRPIAQPGEWDDLIAVANWEE